MDRQRRTGSIAGIQLFHMNDPDEFTTFSITGNPSTREEAKTLGRIIALAEKAMEDTNQKVGEVIG